MFTCFVFVRYLITVWFLWAAMLHLPESWCPNATKLMKKITTNDIWRLQAKWSLPVLLHTLLLVIYDEDR